MDIRGEIIQIGAVRVSEEQFVQDEFQIMVKPKYYRHLNRRVSKLTGIKEARLRDEGKAQIVAHQPVLFHQPAAEPRARVFAEDAHEEIAHADHQQRHAVEIPGRGDQRIELERHAGAHEEQKQDRGAEVVELLEELVVVRDVGIDRAHHHAAEQGRQVQQRAHAAEREQKRHGDDELIVF